MSFYENNKYLIWCTSTIAVGAYLYKMQKKEKVLVYDPKVHTMDLLGLIQREWFVDNSMFLCSQLRKIREAKQNPDLQKEQAIMQEYMHQFSIHLTESKLTILKKYKMNRYLYQQLTLADQKLFEIHWKLQELGDMVLEPNRNGTIEHIKCKNMPKGFNENSYLFVFRKKYQFVRYHCYKLNVEAQSIVNLQEREKYIQQQFGVLIDRLDEFKQKALEIYGIEIQDKNQIELIVDEAQLDITSKSLNLREKIPYSKRLMYEVEEHYEILNQIVGNKGLESYRNQYENNNGDPTIDPATFVDKELTVKQQKRFGIYKEQVKSPAVSEVEDQILKFINKNNK